MPNLPRHFILFFILHGSFVLSQPSSPCPRRYCGSLEIKYPLWLKDSENPKDYYCGFPDLGVNCESSTPVLHAGNDVYLVEASDDNITFTFKDRDLLNSTCPRARHNLTLTDIVGFPLTLRSRNSILFYFNCTTENFLPLSYVPLPPCIKTENGKKSFGVFYDPNLDVLNVGLPCTDYVKSPVNIDTIQNLTRDFPRILRDGFEMKMSEDQVKNCDECESRNGTCSFVKRDKYVFKCQGTPEGRNKTKKIIVGVSAGFGGILLATVFFFLYKRKGRKMQPNTSKLLSWTNSSELSQKKDLENGDDSISSPLFRYEELLDATDGFSPSNELGDGGFGTVYKGKLRDGRIVAVKRLYENNYKRVEQFRNEVDILNGLRHPNLVSLYGCTSRHSRELLLVYEFVPNGTVADHLHGHLASSFKLNWALRLRIAQETAAALAYLHATEPPIIHRDVKTTNILLDANFHVKVADFGLSRLFPLDVTHVSTAPQGTPGYVDPEYHQCYQLTDKSDVYSFGVVLVELISSKPAVDITRLRNEINLSNMAINKIQSGLLGELVDPGLGFESDLEVRRTVEVVAELAFRCLQSDKDMRPSMEDAVEVLSLVGDGGRERETEVEEKKTDEMVLLKALGPPLSPNSVAYNWSSKVTTPNISE